MLQCPSVSQSAPSQYSSSKGSQCSQGSCNIRSVQCDEDGQPMDMVFWKSPSLIQGGLNASSASLLGP
ncbi:hypothetical protein E2C01_020728 [Portunus trituberculatus]|uniref:Uncharacterized protein n=1 Tax=Portunus trituberculatus TaxID=210409 RepID=A0A5B7E2C0_PORTR|nr:hypothetical protein [Portunus trituberculatus]